MLDVRKDFPFLERTVNGKPIAYLDNAATTQKPGKVIDTLVALYVSGVANVHRAVNFLADEVTQAFEAGRETVARFIGAQAREIIFVGNATQAINLACSSLGRARTLRVLTTTLEHHSNLLPWTRQGALEFVPWNPEGKIDLGYLFQRLAQRPDLVTVAQASNFLGSLQPVREIVSACREAGVPVLVDAAQSIAHEPVNVRDLGCDYLAFSGHKLYGPTGVGVLYARNDQVDKMQPLFFGGSMVKEVHAESYVLNDVPHCFEAGTPNIDGVIGLQAAIDYYLSLDRDAIAAHEKELVQYAKCALARIRGLAMYGPGVGERCAPLVSFQIKGLDSTTVAKVLANRANVIVRSGFHCAQPAHDQLGIGPTVRASFGIYNTKEEIDALIEVLEALVRVVH